ncbi:MAG TPA: DNA cytosine methyltransferase [Pyrinomonadaceae bacterium]|jgi:DNA (cytosine-5)-methyltransferase 1|nr:DNA cytosine methyltransferase [Pyrinomonadaceae bacterium]
MRRQKDTNGKIYSVRRCVVDLYSGIGGLGLGVARAGFTLALSVDKDPVLSSVHELNFPNCIHIKRDVAKLSGSDVLVAAKLEEGELSGLVGGSPCQGFSRIGKRLQSDERNQLFIHFFRLVSELRPSFYLVENVQGILDSQNDAVVSEALGLIPSDYVALDAFELNAADFGAATNRKRIFFFGYLPDKCNSLSLADFENARWKTKSNVGAVLTGLPWKIKKEWSKDEKGWRTLGMRMNGLRGDKFYGEIPEGVGDPETIRKLVERDLVSGCIFTNHTEEVEKRFATVVQGKTDSVSRMHRLKKSGLCPTLRAGTGSDRGSYMALRPIHFSEPRVITPREAARLQGFPDWFRFHKTKWHSFRGIGNSVSPFLAEALFRVIRNKLKT